ncbi:MAG TPA: VOC family protein [Flavisolibacter sp.]|nr:VOC family protein [Flavisolibacter sp.]
MKRVLSFFIIIMTLTTKAQKPTINHIAIYVQDLQKSTHFYTNILGLDTIPEPFHDGKHTWLSIGNNISLHLVAGAKTTKEHEQNSHIALSVFSIGPLIDRLKKEGISYVDAQGKANAVTTRTDGIKQIYFKDPDGYWIEINDTPR